MKKEIISTFDALDRHLAQFQKNRKLKDDNEAYIYKALKWIISHQHENGYWGDESVLDTLTSLQALAAWNVVKINWNDYSETSENCVEKAFNWLAHTSQHFWENNIWEVALGIRNANIFGYLDAAWCQDAEVWLVSQEANLWGLDKRLLPHYIAQAVMAMTLFKVPESTILKARNAMIAEVDELLQKGIEITPYVAGQVVEAMVVSGMNLNDRVLIILNNQLKNYLLNVEVSISNWLNICIAARAISLARGNKDFQEPAIELRLQQLFNKNRVRENGSWYNNVHYTSYSLLALDAMESISKIEGNAFDIYQETARSRNDLLILSNKRENKLMCSFGIGAIVGSLITFALVLFYSYLLNNPRLTADGNIIFYVAPLLITLAGAILLRYKPVKK